MRPIYSFQAQSVGDRHLYAWRVLGDFIPRFKKKKKGFIGWVIVTKKLRFDIYLESCRLYLPCQIQSHQPRIRRLLGRFAGGGWGMVKLSGNSVADAQWAASCYDSQCVSVCVSGPLGYEDCAERHQKESLLCVLGNRRQSHPHGAE